ncbi:MAG TPA: class I tRNA ligase family protein [Candidatus Paceibacterota bacterium]|nr:class I tRNA ligase family protein [Candidatus Paceibacterota bacterium]
MEHYDHKKVEEKWQKRWADSGLYKTTEDASKPKSFVLDMFPYPSGEGLHVGHPKGYIATDIYSRMKRMQGHNVLHPMGWDAFGLPAENYALKNKVHPRVAVEKNIATFKEQLSIIGFNYDWSREINTTDPEYYKWTQWIFVQLFKKGLAYQSNEPINWCPSCMTGLANEDLDGNVCERCGSVVEKRALPQWVLKITAYADRMLKDLDALQWPEHIKTAQRNWIGRSEGSEIDFLLNFTFKPEANENRGPNGEKAAIKVFTTRADTLFGATFLVLAPEHPWVKLAVDSNHNVLENKSEVAAYVKAAAAKTEIERTNADKEKAGVELKGVKAINPANGEEIPMFIADYVLGGYGTGAIMAVPAHDERDNAFAKKYNVPVKQVIAPVYVLDGESTPQDGKELAKRIVVSAIVRNPKNDTYIVLKFPQKGICGFVGGGVEEGETPEQTAAREIVEETGYTDFTIKGSVFPIFYGHGYKPRKDINCFDYEFFFIAELNSDTKQELHDQDKDAHEIIWASKEEVEKLLTLSHHRKLWDNYHNGVSHYADDGILINSGEFDGLESGEARVKITEKVGGKLTSTYKIKDWVFSRQRYWGEPIPIIHCEKDGVVAVPEDQLPVLLPDVESYEPSGTGESPLANITDWVNTTCPTCGGPAKRETNTMPQWAGSSWYYLRFMDPHNNDSLVSKELEKYWAPVDVYVGGDHAVRHLIYARFWHKFLYDIEAVSTIEPFARLEFLGFILAEDGRKMSKRYGNVINPTDVVNTYGADAFRAYEMFMGPFENTVAWSTASIAGTARFIERVWKLGASVEASEGAPQGDGPRTEQIPSKESVYPESASNTEALLHQTIKKVGEDIEAFKFNTAVSQMMIFLNAAEKTHSTGSEQEGGLSREQWEIFLRLLAPFAPHVTEELWEKLGHTDSIHMAPWPQFDPALLASGTVTVAVQVNGKIRGSIELTTSATEDEALTLARSNPSVSKHLTGKQEAKAIYVPRKIINFVLK